MTVSIEKARRDGSRVSVGTLVPSPLGKTLNRRLSPQDAAFLFLETNEAPMNIGSVGIFEGEVPFAKFVENINSKIHLIPRYRQRVVPAPFNVGRPTWEFDPDFDISHHIFRTRLESPGTYEQLMDLAARLYEGRLDRDKPLWEIHLVEGLEEERTGIISKVHHCLVDGVSGIELLLVTLDVSPDPPPPSLPAEPYEPAPIPDEISLLFDAVWDNMIDRLGRSARFQKALVDLMMGGDPSGTLAVKRALETALPYFALPVARAPFNQPLSGKRKLDGTEVSFEEIRAIRRASGGTVNDVVLAVLGGALGRYLELHGQSTEDRALRILVPVNVRRADERGTLGNRISMILVEVPVGMKDPIQRLRKITERSAHLKRSHAADGLETIADFLLGLSAPMVTAFAAVGPPPNTVANMVCTNVPGPMIPLYAVGHRMLGGVPVVPIAWQMGVGCAVLSYDHKLYFGLTADVAAAPDIHRLKEFLDEAYLELRRAAGVAAREAVVARGVEVAAATAA